MKYLLDPIFKHYVDLRGRANRTQFWLYTAWMVGVNIVLQIFAAVCGVGAENAGALSMLAGMVVIIVGLGLLLPNLSITVRRLHDTDRSGWWILIGIIPFIGPLVLLVFELLPGTPGENRFGLPPQA